MANSSLALSSLDFDTLKNNFKEFLKSQEVFKDYDFDGSNINVLLDVMSYNTYLNSFYLNMVASEMFLDSAQKYDSIVSHSKELNYTPRSATPAVGGISFDIETDNRPGKIEIPKGTSFTGSNENGTFDFVTHQKSVYISTNNTFKVSNLQIYEGTYSNQAYVVDYTKEDQKFLINDKNVDASSITVNVLENANSTYTPFVRRETLYKLDNQSNVYFLQATDNNRYEIIFGDGYFGRIPQNGSRVLVEYLVTHGSEGNGVKSFTLNDDLKNYNTGNPNTTEITTDVASTGGANQESIESVRFAAPRYFASQQRAVSSDDYASLILNAFGGEVSDVSITGGQDIEPKLYGRIIVFVKPTTGILVPDYLKGRIRNYLKDYSSLANRAEIRDPEYIFVSVVSTVQYNRYTTNMSDSEIKSVALDSIINYSKDVLEVFNSDLRYSRITTYIDDADPSIVSNDTKIKMIKRIIPKLNYITSYSILTNNPLEFEGIYDSKNGMATESYSELWLLSYEEHIQHTALYSSKFTYRYNGTDYPFSYFASDNTMDADGNGNIKVYTLIDNKIRPIVTVGKVNYKKGSFDLTEILISDYTDHISIYLDNKDYDIFANMNNILVIQPRDVILNVIEAKQ